MGEAKKWGKRIVAGTTAAAVGLTGGGIAAHFLQERGSAGAHGAVVDMDEQNGMLLRDLSGRPAFANYFDSLRQGEMQMSISIATTEAMPYGLSNKLGQLTKYRQEHVSNKVSPEDYRPISAESAEVIRHFFAEFEQLTGIKVEVRENDPKADIIIGGYISDDNYIGFASFPQELPLVSKLSYNQGFMMLDVNYLAQRLKDGNPEAVLALVSHEFGHNLGILHPHDGLVHTAMNDKQQDAVARMSYNNHTFPAIATTDIDSGFGPLEIYVLREALRDLGVEPPRINPENNTYLLSEMAETQREQVRAKSGRLGSMPALSLLDNGGHNTLEGTSGNDLLVTESGYCGLLDREQKNIQLTKDGQPYCLVEGEFSVIRSGAGDDLILTASGTEQTVYLGTGRNEVALVQTRVGDKTIVTLPIEDDRGALEQLADAVDELNPFTEKEVPERATEETSRINTDTVTLTLHESLLRSTEARVQQKGDDIQINFYAMSGREVGSITLQGQVAENRGVNTFRIIDNEGASVAEFDVTDLRDAARWQDEVITPAAQTVDEKMMHEMRADLAKARQKLAGTAGEWTSRGEDPAIMSDDKSGEAHTGGCGCPACVQVVCAAPDMRPVTPYYPNDTIAPTNHQDAILRRRRDERDNGHDVLL